MSREIDRIKSKTTPITLDELKVLVAVSDPSEESYKVDVLLTPDVVDYLLSILDTNQRKISDNPLSKVHKQISWNGFRSNIGLMSISCRGTLVDGQHRLRALRMEQKEQTTLTPQQTVVMNLSEEDVLLLDTGKPRSPRDALMFAGKRIDTQIIGAMRLATKYDHRSIPNDLVVREASKQSWRDFMEAIPSTVSFYVCGFNYKLPSYILYVLYQFLIRYGKAALVDFRKSLGATADKEHPIVKEFKSLYATSSQKIRRLGGTGFSSAVRVELMNKSAQLLEKYANGDNVAPQRLNPRYEWKTPQRFYLEEER